MILNKIFLKIFYYGRLTDGSILMSPDGWNYPGPASYRPVLLAALGPHHRVKSDRICPFSVIAKHLSYIDLFTYLALSYHHGRQDGRGTDGST